MGLWASDPADHYASAGERLADGLVHAVGIIAAVADGLVLLALSVLDHGGSGMVAATGVYALCLIAMLSCSAAYNLSKAGRTQPFLRRLDEAAIFLMIAGSYTPFTTQRFPGAWAFGMTSLVWLLALLGVAGKLLPARLPGWIWTMGYVAFGWIALIALRPLIQDVPMTILSLLITGGLIYTSGALIYHSRLPYRRAIWHGFVVAAAGLHYAAICAGVVLAAPI